MSSEKSQSILVLVPAYNAAKYLPDLVPRLRQYVCNDNLLFINDGSSDDSVQILKELNVRHISFQTNRGKGAALRAGFDYAIEHCYRSVLTLDADLQHLPEEVIRFFALDNGERVILGTRKISRAIMPLERWLTNNLTSLIISIFSTQRVRDSQSGYRLIPVDLFKAIQLKTVKFDFESEMLFKAGAVGARIAEVPVSTIYEGSRSYINPFVDTGRFIRQIWKRIWA